LGGKQFLKQLIHKIKTAAVVADSRRYKFCSSGRESALIDI
jgi:hypothetical protein